MITPVITYREASRRLLAQAYVELEAGDVRQASEKGWGAAAQVVKAAAQQRGWIHDHHRALFTAVREITNETSDPEIDILFASANYLHINFYEDALMKPKYGSTSDALRSLLAKSRVSSTHQSSILNRERVGRRDLSLH